MFDKIKNLFKSEAEKEIDELIERAMIGIRKRLVDLVDKECRKIEAEFHAKNSKK